MARNCSKHGDWSTSYRCFNTRRRSTLVAGLSSLMCLVLCRRNTLDSSKVNLSIVTTLYHSSPYLDEFYARVRVVAERITDDFEIILVNDGPSDNSLEIALLIFERDSRVPVIELSTVLRKSIPNEPFER